MTQFDDATAQRMADAYVAGGRVLADARDSDSFTDSLDLRAKLFTEITLPDGTVKTWAEVLVTYADLMAIIAFMERVVQAGEDHAELIRREIASPN